MFKALVINEIDGKVRPELTTVDESLLPAGQVLVGTSYSSMNYKDAMILKGIGKLVSAYPHIPGVDACGVVKESSDDRILPGETVLVGGRRFGEVHWGGYSELVKVPGEWVVRLPDAMTAFQSMAFGTAGLSAMLALMSLEEHGLGPERGEVLITGAAGGVGSIAVALLASLGYSVTASTGRMSEARYLRDLGASEVIDRAILEEPAKPLEKERWAACIDNVGGASLGKILSQMKYNGSIAAVGLAGGAGFSANVMPFLLRGANILGIDSVMASRERRSTAWERLAREFPLQLLDATATMIPLEDVPQYADKILGGKVRGRLVVAIG